MRDRIAEREDHDRGARDILREYPEHDEAPEQVEEDVYPRDACVGAIDAQYFREEFAFGFRVVEHDCCKEHDEKEEDGQVEYARAEEECDEDADEHVDRFSHYLEFEAASVP